MVLRGADPELVWPSVSQSLKDTVRSTSSPFTLSKRQFGHTLASVNNDHDVYPRGSRHLELESHGSKREQPRHPAPTQLEDHKICRLSPSLDAHVAPTSPAPRKVFTWPLLLSGRWLSWTSSLSEPGRGSVVHCLCLVHTMHCPSARLALTHCPMCSTPDPQASSLIHSPQEE